MSARFLCLLGAVLLAACATPPSQRLAAAASMAPVAPKLSSDGKVASVQLDVLTFNIEGLAWPARTGRALSLAEISRILDDLQSKGQGPDIVLIQEMFSPAAMRAIGATGYANLVSGPSRTQRKSMVASARMPGRYLWKKGELGFHFVGSGLAILSRYPIIATHSEPYGRRCAGFDCLSNKGVLHAQIAIPGVPQPIDIFDTHMNSQEPSRVPIARHAAAHERQVAELGDFLAVTTTPGTPVILGGDFNMRHSELRFKQFEKLQSLELVHRYCLTVPAACEVRMSWDGDEPWLDTQDLQLFASGHRVAVVPVRVAAMFDGSPGSPQLSDHDGFRVVYNLSWAVLPGDISRTGE